ncbi:hypothetical protein PFISCL1PPCAC_23441, partial [Pristionchus fissidentatus]
VRPRKSAAAVVPEKWYGFSFPESKTYYAFGASKLPANFRKMSIGQTLPMKWDKEICDACCVVIDTKEAVEALIEELIEGVTTLEALNLPKIDKTSSTPKSKNEKKTPKKVEKKKNEVKTPTTSRSRGRAVRLDNGEQEGVTKEAEEATAPSSSRRGGKRSGDKSEAETHEDVSPKKRGRPMKKDKSPPVSTAVKEYDEATKRLENAEKAVEVHRKKKEDADRSVVEAEDELKKARCNLEEKRKLKIEEEERIAEEERVKEEERKKREEEEERVKEEQRLQKEEEKRKKEEEKRQKEEQKKEEKRLKEEEKKQKEEQKREEKRLKEEEKRTREEEERQREEEANSDEPERERALSDESGVHVVMPDIDSDMNGDADDEIQYIETRPPPQIGHDEAGPSTSSTSNMDASSLLVIQGSTSSLSSGDIETIE